jgi:carboxyl-terminal processing protease
VTGRAVLAACAGLLAAGSLLPPVRAQAPQAVETFDAVWRIVRDTHFDKSLNGVNWDAARDEFRPKAAETNSTADLRRVLNTMLGRLGQSHFVVIPGSLASDPSANAGTANPGFDVRLLDNSIVVTRVEEGGGAAAAAVRTGWSVVAIDGKPVGDLLTRLQEAPDPRVRALEGWRAVQARLRGSEGSAVDVTFADGGGAHVRRTLKRHQEQGHPVTVGNLPTMYVQVTDEARKTPAGGQAGIVGFNIWMAAVDAPFQKAIDRHRSAAGIVVDLRGNPGGLAGMMMGIAGHFIGERTPLGIMKTRDTELRFTVNPRLVSADGQRVEPYAGPVAILVDGLTGSASECFSGGMQSLKRVQVFGERSMGAALPSQFEKLPNGDVFIHATGDFVTADGTRLEGRGVIPDQEVRLTRADLLAGRDAPLEAALKWIDAERAK